MINVKYGIDNPTHDIMKEVPCAVVANPEALADNKMFSLIPILLSIEVAAATVGFSMAILFQL
jgi:hypothetical protein